MPKIGNLELKNNIIAAPMAGFSDYPFRKLALEAGVGLVYSEMISATALYRKDKKTAAYADIRDDRPIALQIFGNRIEELVFAAQYVQDRGADIVDLNMGCPVPKVIKQSAGAALLKDLGHTAKVLEALRKVIKTPFTIKIRSGWEDINFLETAKIAEACGVDMITLHPRTRKQAYTGFAKWEYLKELKNSVKIPVCGSGDVKTAIDIEKMQKETGVDFVMVARGLIGNPWIISDYLKGKQELTEEARKKVLIRHFELLEQTVGEYKAVRLIRKYVSKYLKGVNNVAYYRTAVNSIQSTEEFMSLFGEPPVTL